MRTDNGAPIQRAMNRRESIKGLGLIVAGGAVAPSVLADFFRVSAAISESGERWTPVFVPARHAELLAELVETIIPKTDSPGAKEALVHVFVDLYVKDCYPKERQDVFLAGLDGLDALAGKDFGRAFLALSGDERLALLRRLEKESLEKGEAADASFVRSLKSVTLLGYFTSKPGVTQATGYVHAPGPFKGCVDLKPGQKADALS
jgi:gluconate 2-dehydrogenase gamma chain